MRQRFDKKSQGVVQSFFNEFDNHIYFEPKRGNEVKLFVNNLDFEKFKVRFLEIKSSESEKIINMIDDFVEAIDSIHSYESKDSKSIQSSCYFEHDDSVRIYQDDILKVPHISRSSVDLVITSPPYNVDIDYNSHHDGSTYQEYLNFTKKWLKKCYTLTKNDGRFCLNIPLDKNKGGQQSVCADITAIAKEVGWQYHSTIIWNEGNISRRTAWGSWMSPSAPYVIAPVEVIVVLYKKEWKKDKSNKESDITRQEFMDWTNGVWTFNGQSKKGAGGHPAAFPVELPKRCIKLFSFIGDTILDPFLGSGSTLIAAQLHNRKSIGVDIDEGYCNIAIERLCKEANIRQNNLFIHDKKTKK